MICVCTRPFPSDPKFPLKNERKCEAYERKTIFIRIQIQLIFTSIKGFADLASFKKGRFLKLVNKWSIASGT